MEHHDGITTHTARKLENLAKFIEKLPRKHFNMMYWGAKELKKDQWDGYTKVCPIDFKNEQCGTACCIAGWQVIRKGYCLQDSTVYNKSFTKDLGLASEVAAAQLGLERYQAEAIYMPVNWPRKDKTLFLDAKSFFTIFPNTPKGAAKRIRYFIKTGM